jgi:cytochrome b561
MNKCIAEIIFILMYVVVLGYFIIGIIYQQTYGNIIAVLVEVGIALVAD